MGSDDFSSRQCQRCSTQLSFSFNPRVYVPFSNHNHLNLKPSSLDITSSRSQDESTSTSTPSVTVAGSLSTVPRAALTSSSPIVIAQSNSYPTPPPTPAVFSTAPSHPCNSSTSSPSYVSPATRPLLYPLSLRRTDIRLSAHYC